MASRSTSQPQPINAPLRLDEAADFDYPFSPNEPGKFDFYRTYVNNQNHKTNPTFSDNHYETFHGTTELPKHWNPLSTMKHLYDQGKTSSSSSSSIFLPTSKSSAEPDVPTVSQNTQNKPIQTVASFSSLADAVKNAMHRGNLNTTADRLRQQTNGTTLSSKDLNHLSPQSM